MAHVTDFEDGVLTVTEVTQPEYGSVEISPDGKSVYFDPLTNPIPPGGSTSFQYTVEDSQGLTDTKTCTVSNPSFGELNAFDSNYAIDALDLNPQNIVVLLDRSSYIDPIEYEKLRASAQSFVRGLSVVQNKVAVGFYGGTLTEDLAYNELDTQDGWIKKVFYDDGWILGPEPADSWTTTNPPMVYKRIQTKGSWTTQKAVAASLGANLVTILNEELNDFIRDTFAQSERVVIGASKVGDAWDWDNPNEEFGYSNWASNPTGEYAVMLEQSGHWGDLNNEDVNYTAIIEKPSTGMTEHVKYYKKIEQGTWSESQTQARLEGGTLVTIASAGENEWLVDTFVTERTWIGYTDNVEEDIWLWDSGETTEYGFEPWREADPNNLGDVEHYADIMADGLWSDRNPSTSLPAIIERPVGIEFQSLVNETQSAIDVSMGNNQSNAINALNYEQMTGLGDFTEALKLAYLELQAENNLVVIFTGGRFTEDNLHWASKMRTELNVKFGYVSFNPIAFNTPQDWIQYGHKALTLQAESTFEDAKTLSESLGGTVLSVYDELEADWVYENIGPVTNRWLNLEKVEDTWIGTGYNRFKFDEPKATIEAEVAVLGSDTKYWATSDKDQSYGVIVQQHMLDSRLNGFGVWSSDLSDRDLSEESNDQNLLEVKAKGLTIGTGVINIALYILNPNDSTLSYSLTVDPEHGTVLFDAETQIATYTVGSFTDSDSFEYKVTDPNTGQEALASVYITKDEL